jgi:hypothetical protein
VTEAGGIQKVVFRIPPTAHLAPLLLAVAAIPFAFAAPLLWLIYVVPIAVIVWIFRNRTVATSAGLTARSTFASTSLAWDDVKSLKLGKRGGVSAVGTEGAETRLPGVRLRHLSLLSRVSGGRIPDPAAEPAEPADSADPVGEPGDGPSPGN